MTLILIFRNSKSRNILKDFSVCETWLNEISDYVVAGVSLDNYTLDAFHIYVVLENEKRIFNHHSMFCTF